MDPLELWHDMYCKSMVLIWVMQIHFWPVLRSGPLPFFLIASRHSRLRLSNKEAKKPQKEIKMPSRLSGGHILTLAKVS